MIKIEKYDKKVDSKKDLTTISNKCYKKCKIFFGKEAENIKIHFCYTRKEFDLLTKRKSPAWMVGVAGENIITIFSLSVFSKVSSHPQSDFIPVLTHEIAHIFTRSIFGKLKPVWLNEGISGYVAEQYKNRKFTGKMFQKFEKMHNKKDWEKNHNYPQAYSYSKYFIESTGKKLFFKLLVKLSNDDSYKIFCEKFEKIIGISFNKSYHEWLEKLNNDLIEL
jgi:hypothetical protein